MRQIIPHRNNMCMRRSEGKKLSATWRGVSGRCDDSATARSRRLVHVKKEYYKKQELARRNVKS